MRRPAVQQQFENRMKVKARPAVVADRRKEPLRRWDVVPWPKAA
jgi:hypothetical protein